MNQRGLAVVIAILLVAAAACGRGRAPDGERERAYRANNRGVALLEQFKYPEAAEAFREALRTDESLAIARVNLSLAFLYALDLQGAAREATEAARLLPSAPQPPYILGLIARAENRGADAQRAFERVHQLDAADVGTDINLGQIHLEERRYADATQAFRRAAAAEPYNVTAAYNLGLALTRSGQVEEGRQALEHAQTLRTTGYAVTYGTGYLEQGRYAEAVASTGAEPDLVDPAAPPVSFAPTAIGPAIGQGSAEESPFGRIFAAGDLTPSGAQAMAAGLGGGVTLADVDNDGDLDLFTASSSGQRLFLNDGGTAWTDATKVSGLVNESADVVPVGCVAGDFDNDGMADLFVLRYGGSALYHNDGNGRFSDVTAAARLPPYPFLPGAAALTDLDHDGDLDLVVAGLADLAETRQRAAGPLVFPRDFVPAPLQLLRNNGNGTFTDITAAAQVKVATHAIAIVPTDFDNKRDIDLLVVNRDAPPMLFQNLRDGTFRDVAVAVGLGVIGASEITAVTAADVNKDEFPDFFFGSPGGGVFALSDGRGRLTRSPAPDAADAARAAQFLDYDNDGLLDLLTWSASGPQVSRNLGQRWVDVSRTAVPGSGGRASPSPRGLALADVNGDGSTDLIAGDSRALTFWRNSGASGVGRRSLGVALRGRVGNRLGIGAKVQLRAGSLAGRLETSAATPAVAPADLLFGLGTRAEADVVRALWPSGILQAEDVQRPGGASPAAPLPQVTINELDRKPSSCPFLFTWNGERFEFVTDFLGGGEMGYWAGPGADHQPDPVEYVRIRGEQLRPRDGKLEIRVTNELEEALFVDRLQLMTIDHPREMEVYPNEGMTDPPKPFRLFAVAERRVPRAIDGHGHEVTERVARIDRRYADDFALERFRGYAAPHTLTFDLAPVSDAPVLLLTGWTDYAFSSDNLAAHQSGLSLSPPSLQIKERSGRWRTAIADIGIPVGRPQTVPVDLAGVLRPGEHEVRVATNMRIYWDHVAIGRAVSTDRLMIDRLDPRAAVLRDRGFSHEVRPDAVAPASYQYNRVGLETPWKIMTGRYTREGDVRELVSGADDRFVIAKPGDEIALDFDARPTAVPDVWMRTYLLLADGYSKEMDINSASPDTVEPLPFHAMTRYPYRVPERYPASPEHEHYRATYNTRVVVKTLPPIGGKDLTISTAHRE